MNVGVLGTGHYLPTNVLTNKDMESIVDTTDEWITSRTGIEERRLATDEIDSSDMAFIAAEGALEEAQVKAIDIDLILVATVTPDTPFPSVACIIQDKLGATNARSEEHTSELQSRGHLVCRLLLEKKKIHAYSER